MNILVVSSGIISDVDFDGYAIRKKKMLEGLKRNGYKVILLMQVLFIPKSKGEIKFVKSFKSYVFPANLRILFLGSLSKIFRFQCYPLASIYCEAFSRYKERVKEIIKENKIDLIQCECQSTAPQMQRFAKEIPIVITAHDVLTDRYRDFFEYRRTPRIISNRILKWLKRIEIETLKNASYTVCCSKDDETRFIELGVPVERLTTITSGATDIERFYPMPPDKKLQDKLGLTGSEPVLFFGGADSIQNVKAAQDIAKFILPPLIEEFPNIKMLFTGTLSRAISLKRLAERFPGRIINAGFVNKLEHYYSLVNVVIFPITIGSGIKLKVAEAMAAGKPIISTRKGIMGYDLKNNEHLIIEDDLRLFPAHIKKLLEDAELRENLGRNARTFMLGFDWKPMMDGYQNIYYKVLNQNI